MKLEAYPYTPTPGGWAQPGVYPPEKPPNYTTTTTLQGGMEQQQRTLRVDLLPVNSVTDDRNIQSPPPPY